MKLVRWPCKIVGLRVGEIKVDLLRGPILLSANYVLLRDPEKNDGANAGRYDKNRDWSERASKALEAFIEVLEEEALPEIFEVEGDDRLRTLDDATKENEEKPLSFPTLGGE